MSNKLKASNEDVGVVVGRWQAPFLTEGQESLIRDVISKHHQVIIFVGVSLSNPSENDPYDYQVRYSMLHQIFDGGEVTIAPISDMVDDVRWSKKLDDRISEMCKSKSIRLYGSRDSFIPNYHGKYKTTEMDSKVFISASEVRDHLRSKVPTEGLQRFMEGINYSVNNKYYNPIPCVDIAVIDLKEYKILLGRKPNEDELRLIGGFVDVTDVSNEHAAKRELLEEAGSNLVVHEKLDYVSSMVIDDFRYRNQKTSIMTSFFIAYKSYGNATVTDADDIIDFGWYSLDDIENYNIIKGHKRLILEGRTFLAEKKVRDKAMKSYMLNSSDSIGI